MTIQSVPPEGETAQSVLARQNLEVVEDRQLDDMVAMELDAVRAAADKAFAPQETPQDIVPFYNAASPYVEPTIPPPIDQQFLTSVTPPPTAEIYPPFFKTIDIRISDGRTITLGPPEIPHMLVLPKMFAGQGERSQVEIQSEMMLAKNIQYVRVFNGRSMGRAIFDYQQMIGLVHELGEVGLKAVMDAVGLYWPDAGPVLWTELKKNLP